MDNKNSFRKIICITLILSLLAGAAGYVTGKKGFSWNDFKEDVHNTVSLIKRNRMLRKKMKSLPPAIVVDSVSEGKYAYESLTESEKIVYDQMLDAILNYGEEITVSTMKGQLLEKIYACIKADYGGLFWIASYRYTIYKKNKDTKILSFTPNFKMTEEERDAIRTKIDKKVDKYLKGLDADADDFEKVRYVYEKLIKKVDYNWKAKNSQNIMSVFLQGETVCQGYSDAVQYMLQKLGIDCMVISGTANDGPHAWNLVKLDGEWYYLDITWGNSAYHDDAQGNVKYVQYDYLNVTDREILSNHSPQMPFALPVCTATEDNYYVHEEKYFEEFSEATADKIGEMIREAYEKGEQAFSVKFSTDALSKKARNYFLKEYHIKDYIPILDRVYYNTDSQMNIFTIIF